MQDDPSAPCLLREAKRRPAYFFSMDLSLRAEDILRRVIAWWSLETLFRDTKEHLGLQDWQCGPELAGPLTCVAATPLMLWSHEEGAQE